jgi:4-amino-4-deoxy-L-arabinose transferase-like glycosyltransferase
MNIYNTRLMNLLIIIAGALMFIPYLGSVHLFDWDEVNFAESAREMLMTGNYLKVQINYQTFWEKPPFFIWIEAISMNIFGINEFAARLPNAIIGIITLAILFNIGRKAFDPVFGIFWVITYAGSFLPHFYFKSGIIDPYFNLFIFLGIYFVWKISSVPKGASNRKIFAMMAGIFLGLAVLTKGPVALIISGLTILIYFFVRRSIKIFSWKEVFIFSGSLLLIACSWFLIIFIIDGPFFVTEFIDYQIRLFKTKDAGHGGPFFYHFLVLLFGCFPASMFIVKAFGKKYSDTVQNKQLKSAMVICLLVVLILFSIVETKIVHYSSFCYFPITFLAAYTLHKVYRHKIFMADFFRTVVLCFGFLFAFILTALPLCMINLKAILKWFAHATVIKDDFVLANLEANVSWSFWESMIGVFYFIALIIFFILAKKNLVRATIILYFATMVTLQCVLYFIVPKVEGYIQASVIDFYQSKKGQDVYVEVHGFKSYAHLFYFEKKPGNRPESFNEEWLLRGKIDKPVYFVTKITNHDLDNMAGIKLINSKNGFSFYERLPGP